MKTDQLIDRFVEKINSSPREPLWPDDIPPALRFGSSVEYGCYDWLIQRPAVIDWIQPYEEKLPARLPPTFHSLVTRYVYPELEIGDLWLFANTRTKFDHEWRTAVDVDDATDGLAQMLAANGYIQFARPYEPANWDAICFDTSRCFGNGEYPIVQIDHESDKIRVTRRIMPSFAEIIEDYVNSGTGLKL